MTPRDTATAVYQADADVKARFDVDATSLRVKGGTALILAGRCDNADTLRALIASCDTDVYAATVAAMGVDPLAVTS